MKTNWHAHRMGEEMELQLAERKRKLKPPGKEKQCQQLYVYPSQGKKQHPRAMNALLTPFTLIGKFFLLLSG